MEIEYGILYGIGVGPGDPELLTLQAVRTVVECDVLAIPVSDSSFTHPVFEQKDSEAMEAYLSKCVAYQIMLQEVEEIASLPKLYLPMPMIKDVECLKDLHERGADAVETLLSLGDHVAFLTLGDPSVYSTYLYIQKRMKHRGYQTCIIPGIPSFCAAAARLNIGLAENKDELHILPASYEIEQGLSLPGTKVLMKAGSKMSDVKKLLQKRALHTYMVENCGMKNEHIYRSLNEIPEEAGYYSLLIIKEAK